VLTKYRVVLMILLMNQNIFIRNKQFKHFSHTLIRENTDYVKKHGHKGILAGKTYSKYFILVSPMHIKALILEFQSGEH